MGKRRWYVHAIDRNSNDPADAGAVTLLLGPFRQAHEALGRRRNTARLAGHIDWRFLFCDIRVGLFPTRADGLLNPFMNRIGYVPRNRLRCPAPRRQEPMYGFIFLAQPEQLYTEHGASSLVTVWRAIEHTAHVGIVRLRDNRIIYRHGASRHERLDGLAGVR